MHDCASILNSIAKGTHLFPNFTQLFTWCIHSFSFFVLVLQRLKAIHG